MNKPSTSFLFYKTHASSTNEEHTKYVQQKQENDDYIWQ